MRYTLKDDMADLRQNLENFLGEVAETRDRL